MKQGCVSVSDYDDFLRSEGFAEVERHAAEFLRANQAVLAPYARRWVHDPLHQWSRVWEYPFTAHWVTEHLCARAREPARILDAGSGITFFPYLLASRLPGAEVTCVDQDGYLAQLYRAIRHPAAERVRFTAAALAQTGLPGGVFDAIYCISVLEHTRDYGAILDEFRRLLKPGGRLVVTMDVSLDGRSDISLPRLCQLLADLAGRFRPLDGAALEQVRRLDADGAGGLVTTTHVRRTRSDWLPWRYPRLSGALASVRLGRLPRFAIKQLTFACLALAREP